MMPEPFNNVDSYMNWVHLGLVGWVCNVGVNIWTHFLIIFSGIFWPFQMAFSSQILDQCLPQYPSASFTYCLTSLDQIMERGSESTMMVSWLKMSPSEMKVYHFSQMITELSLEDLSLREMMGTVQFVWMNSCFSTIPWLSQKLQCWINYDADL